MLATPPMLTRFSPPSTGEDSLLAMAVSLDRQSYAAAVVRSTHGERSGGSAGAILREAAAFADQQYRLRTTVPPDLARSFTAHDRLNGRNACLVVSRTRDGHSDPNLDAFQASRICAVLTICFATDRHPYLPGQVRLRRNVRWRLRQPRAVWERELPSLGSRAELSRLAIRREEPAFFHALVAHLAERYLFPPSSLVQAGLTDLYAFCDPHRHSRIYRRMGFRLLAEIPRDPDIPGRGVHLLHLDYPKGWHRIMYLPEPSAGWQAAQSLARSRPIRL